MLTLEISEIEWGHTGNFKNKYGKRPKTLAQKQSRNIKHQQLTFIQDSIIGLYLVVFIV